MEFTQTHEQALENLRRIILNAGEEKEFNSDDKLYSSLKMAESVYMELRQFEPEQLVAVKEIIGEGYIDENVPNYGFFVLNSPTQDRERIDIAIKLIRTYETIAKYYTQVEKHRKLGKLEQIFFGGLK